MSGSPAQMSPAEAGRAAADLVPRIPDHQAEAMARLLIAQARPATHEQDHDSQSAA